jgi:DNA-binding NtrC family response regulator
MMDPVHDMVGDSPALARVIDFIRRYARSKANVLIDGESGTGKELAARALHRNSDRAHGPFVAVNCAALPEDLLENELFGHEPGAFTGALRRQSGKFELADGGTLFLDEIGEISARTQATLLRAVEYGEIQRIGGGKPAHADFRLIAATNRDLLAAMSAGGFRQDLYYRLNVLRLTMPPLRERREDIPVLARHFINTSPAAAERGVTAISPEAESVLCNYDWPGNIRQLKNVMDRAIEFASADVIQRDEISPLLIERLSAALRNEPENLHDAVFRAKRQFVEQVVNAVGGNLRKAAEMLGRHPAGLSRMLDSLDLSRLKKPRGRYGTT